MHCYTCFMFISLSVYAPFFVPYCHAHFMSVVIAFVVILFNKLSLLRAFAYIIAIVYVHYSNSLLLNDVSLRVGQKRRQLWKGINRRETSLSIELSSKLLQHWSLLGYLGLQIVYYFQFIFICQNSDLTPTFESPPEGGRLRTKGDRVRSEERENSWR